MVQSYKTQIKILTLLIILGKLNQALINPTQELRF